MWSPTSSPTGAGMARHFWPEQLVVVDQLPKTASGKIQKFRLREQLGAGAPSKAPPEPDPT